MKTLPGIKRNLVVKTFILRPVAGLRLRRTAVTVRAEEVKS